MELFFSYDDLKKFGLSEHATVLLVDEINAACNVASSARDVWQTLCKSLIWFNYPFEVHFFIYSWLFANWRNQPELAPVFIPTIEQVAEANITQFMADLNFATVAEFHQYTTENFQDFWQRMVLKFGIVFKTPYESVCDLEAGIESPAWFKNATVNIADSCFSTDYDAPAIVSQTETGQINRQSYRELDQLSNRIANGLIERGFKAGDHIGIIMPMTAPAIAIYLGIIKMGAVVVSVPDSFSVEEIAVRTTIADTKLIFTQQIVGWGSKQLGLYAKLKSSSLPPMIVQTEVDQPITLRKEDVAWVQFLSPLETFESVARKPEDAINILFSSGTTAAPKAIAWNQLTPLKCASDAFFHQNIKPGDVLAWPTNLGWMMGPWLLFAALINRATLALYVDSPKEKAFGEFIEAAKVTMLGVVPTLVASWRQTQCMEGLNWEAIKVFTSTGECSSPDDMLYLMYLGRYKPVIEYCGGTEIGGAYVSSTVVQDNVPSLFSTKVMGMDFVIIDEEGQPSDLGEVAIIPPSIGLSTTLLNANHHEIYYANMPKYQDRVLRRHGDLIQKLSNDYYIILGRTDDSMNLGGIKISAAEIERALAGIADLEEVAAIAVAPKNHGPSQLIIYVVSHAKLDKNNLLNRMQKQINGRLNPLFKIKDIVFIEKLPRTASNKVMRRTLRKAYESGE